IAPVQAAIDARQRRKEDEATRQAVLTAVSWKLPWGFPQDEKQRATEAAQKAAANLPEGTARAELERARDKALQPFLDAHDSEKRKAERRAEIERRLEAALPHVDDYLGQLVRQGEIKYRSWSDRWEEAKEMREEIRPDL